MTLFHPLRLACLTVLLLGFHLLQAQDGLSRLIRGQVIAGWNQEPLPQTLISESGALNAAITDEEGRFTLKVGLEATTLEVKRLGFEPQTVRIPKGTSLHYITITMDIRETEIEGFTITDKKPIPLYPDHKLHVQDYEFLSGFLLSIVYDRKKRQNKLLLSTLDGEPLQEFLHPKAPPGELTRDCLGRVHFLTSELACQVDYIDGELIIQEDSLHRYLAKVAPCMGFLDSTYYFSASNHPYRAHYIYIKSEDRVKRHLYGVEDSVAVQTFKDERQIEGRQVSPELMYAGPRAKSAKSFQDGLNRTYLQNVQLKKIYVPLLIINGTACVFDHIRGKLWRFDREGEVLHTAPIRYHQDRNWARKVIADEGANRAFTWNEKNGYFSLLEIDLETGKLINSWEIPQRFPTLLRVYKGYLYFLYWDRNYDPARRLYRMEL